MHVYNARRQVVDKLVGAFVAIDVFLEKVLQEHEKTYDPEELRDFVDVYIKTRSESGDCSHLYTGEAGGWGCSKRQAPLLLERGWGCSKRQTPLLLERGWGCSKRQAPLLLETGWGLSLIHI